MQLFDIRKKQKLLKLSLKKLSVDKKESLEKIRSLNLENESLNQAQLIKKHTLKELNDLSDFNIGQTVCPKQLVASQLKYSETSDEFEQLISSIKKIQESLNQVKCGLKKLLGKEAMIERTLEALERDATKCLLQRDTKIINALDIQKRNRP